MNKSDLVDQIAAKTDLSKRQANDAVDAFTDSVVETLERNSEDKVTIPGFGSFRASHRSARKGRNPQTGEPMTIPPQTVPRFKAGKNFKERLKNS